MKQGEAFIVFLIYLVFGLYFVTSSLDLVTFPDFMLKIDRWIILVGGVLIVIGGINYLRNRSRLQYLPPQRSFLR